MPSTAGTSDNPFLTTEEAALLLRLSPRTLERMRIQGDGPPYFKAGPGKRSRVLYKKAGLEAWVASFAYASTSEYPR